MSYRTKLFVDSGAFSAFRLRKPVDLKQYIKWIKDNEEWIELYVNLDVIIPENPEAAAKAGYLNLMTMRGRGLKPMPVFHVGESIDWLKRMLDLGCDYIGLSASSLTSRRAMDDWYELAWSYLVDAAGDPVVRVHAFGETRVAALLKFPWASADSSTWLNGQRYGYFHAPIGRNGQRMNHSIVPQHTKSLQDVSLLEGADASLFADVLKQLHLLPSAFEYRRGGASWAARAYVSACFFKFLEDNVNDARPVRFRPEKGLLSIAEPFSDKKPKIEAFSLYMAMSLNNSVPAIFRAVGIDKPLISFFYVNDVMTERVKLLVRDPEKGVRQEPYGKYVEVIEGIMDHAHD